MASNRGRLAAAIPDNLQKEPMGAARKRSGVQLSSLSIPKTKVSTLNAIAATRGSVDVINSGTVVLDGATNMKLRSDSMYNPLDSGNSPRSNYKMRTGLAQIISNHTMRLEQSLKTKEKHTDKLYTKFLQRQRDKSSGS